jgi:hypothetical protein
MGEVLFRERKKAQQVEAIMRFKAEIDENLQNVEGSTIKSVDLYAKQKKS